MVAVTGPWFLLSVATLALFCASHAAAKPAASAGKTRRAPAGRAFVLRPGEPVQSAGVTVELVSVIEDSRCPKGEQCIWAGRAVVELRVRSRDAASSLVRLGTDPGAASAVSGDAVLRLVAVDPYPTAGARIAPGNYRITLVACTKSAAGPCATPSGNTSDISST